MTRKRGAGRFSIAFSSLRTFLGQHRHGKSMPRRLKSRPLRIESYEARHLLAAVAGTMFEDITGNGFTPDDLPTGGVTVELFRDGGDGVFDMVDDTLADSQVSAAGTGAYTFSGLTDGRYFMREQVPPGLAQTAGPEHYTLDVVGPLVGLLVDDFLVPDPFEVYAIDAIHPDPTLAEHSDVGILGGERDLLADVIGVPNPISLQVQVGNGSSLSFASADPGSRITLQYDGIDADPVGPPAELSVGNTFDSPVDLTAAGTNTGLRLAFDMLQAGTGTTEMGLEVIATSTGGSAEFSGLAPEAPDPTYFVPFSSFVPTGAFSFAQITSLEFILNENGFPDVDFRLHHIVAENPDGTGFDFGNYFGQPLSSLSGYVYVDVNDDGSFNMGVESPLPNTTITLTGIDDLGDPVTQKTFTDAAGKYLFADLRPGIYTIHETQPDAFLDGKDTIGTPGGVTTNDTFSAVDLPADFHGTMNNFGERGLKPGVVSKRSLLWPWNNWGHEHDGTGTSGPLPGSIVLGGTAGGGEDAPTPAAADLESTPGNDLFEFAAGATPGDWIVKLNGVVQDIDPGTGALHFDGLDGEDTVILKGTGGNETLVLGPDFGLMVGDTYAVTVSNVEQITVYGGGGNDLATFRDSAGDDTLVQWPTGTILRGTGFRVMAVDFATVSAHSTAGGFDQVRMYDSSGNDRFVGAVGYAKMSGDGFTKEAVGFDRVHIFGTAGGFDVARLYDSPGDDRFAANPIQGALFGPGFYNRAKFFEQVHAFASAGGHDVAKLYDSPGDDRFVANPTEAALFGPGFYNRAKFFDEVHARASTGYDQARLFDSAGDDLLEAAGDWARLSRDGWSAWMSQFDYVHADSSAGGTDSKHIEAVNFLMLADGPWSDI